MADYVTDEVVLILSRQVSPLIVKRMSGQLCEIKGEDSRRSWATQNRYQRLQTGTLPLPQSI